MFNKKPLMCAGISAVLLLFLPIIFSLLGLIGWLDFFSILSNISALILSVYFMYGFYYLGLKYKNKFLTIVSLVGIVSFVVLYFTLAVFSGPISNSIEQFNQTISQQQTVLDNLNITNASVVEMEIVQTEMQNAAISFLVPFLIVFLGVVFGWLVFSVLFNIGLMKLKKVRYSKITGIIGLVCVVLTLTLFGVLLAIPLVMAYYIMLIVILFNESKKFKEYR